jgi:hypothetical protein
MDCRDIEFSPEKSQERMDRAWKVFPPAVLDRVLAFGLHLQGASRKEIASLVNRPEESVKTSIRVLLRDGLPALRDRRCSDRQPVASAPVGALAVSTRREGEWQVVDFGAPGKELRIPAEHKIQLRTVLLSFLDSGLLSVEETAAALGISQVHCRELKSKLACADVEESLTDKRRGQTQDYRMGPDEKAELIQQFAARAVLRLSTSSQMLAELVNERAETSVSARTVRWHMKKLGLTAIRKTLPDLVDVQKKLFGKAP